MEKKQRNKLSEYSIPEKMAMLVIPAALLLGIYILLTIMAN